MTLDEIRWMTRLFEMRNMTKTAESLFISQPALSQCVKRIEEELGFPLFTRSNKGLMPTEKGLLFAEAACTITDIYRDFQVKADLAARTSLTDIVIGMPPFLSACCSADVIEQISEACPGIRFSVHEGSWDTLLSALRSNEIQIAVTSGPLELSGVRIHNFGNGSLVIFLRKGSGIADRVFTQNGVRYLDPRYLAHEPIAMTKPGQATRRLAENLMREAGISPDIQQESRHIETLYRYAQKGIATAVAPLMGNAHERDRVDQLICRVPESYRWRHVCGCLVTLPETDRLIPSIVFQIIKNNVIGNSQYLLPV